MPQALVRPVVRQILLVLGREQRGELSLEPEVLTIKLLAPELIFRRVRAQQLLLRRRKLLH